MFRERGIEIKTPEQLDGMRRAGLVVGRTLEVLCSAVRPGISTAELDAVAEREIRDAGASPSFLGYHGFPGSICTSVNEVVVHGIPGDRVLSSGDVISIDCGAIVDGWHGDAATTIAVGEVPGQVQDLMRTTEDALWRGIVAGGQGRRVGDISHAVESHVRSAGDYGILEDYVGHGIGSAMHQPPNVPNVGRAGKGPRIVAGMALAIEPMVVLGSPETDVLADDWTVLTRDGRWSAHYEHSVTWTEQGPWVLTALDGGAERLAALGVSYGGREV